MSIGDSVEGTRSERVYCGNSVLCGAKGPVALRAPVVAVAVATAPTAPCFVKSLIKNQQQSPLIVQRVKTTVITKSPVSTSASTAAKTVTRNNVDTSRSVSSSWSHGPGPCTVRYTKTHYLLS